MKAGSSPCAPRYFDETGSPPGALCCMPPKSPPLPEMRAVAEEPCPVSSAITRSTGPPGANCTTTKEISMMPITVGTISAMRRTI
ncbi:hypothetical protein ACFSKM_20410 [Ancylobacter dichloromethanicus]